MEIDFSIYTETKVSFFNTEPCNIAVIFCNPEDQTDYIIADKNLSGYGSRIVLDKCDAFLDVNHYPGLPKQLEESGLAKPVLDPNGNPITLKPGHVTYPLFKFNAEKLKELDPKGFAEYDAQYLDSLQKAIEDLNVDDLDI